jgi:hypothetical protein
MSNRQKSGLHKEISSIFSGVPLPSDNANGPLMDMEKKDNTAGHIPPMPTEAVKGPQLIQQEPSKLSPKADEKPAPAPQKSASAPALQKSAPAPAPEKGGAGSANKKSQLKGFRKSLSNSLKPLLEKLMTPPEGVSRTKHMAIVALVPVLLLVVVLVFGRLLLKSGSKSKTSENDTEISSVTQQTKIDWKQPEVYPEGLRDPMKRSYRQPVTTTVTNIEPTTADSGIVVRGIAWSEDNPAVIVGTEIYYQGQVVHDAKIIKINTDSVEFEKDGKTWTQKVSN